MIESVAFVNVYFPCKSGTDIRGRNYTDIVYTMIDDLNDHLSTLAPKYVLFGGDLNI